MVKKLSVISILTLMSGIVAAQDFMRIVKAGSHTIEENERHKTFCQQYNAIDVTDLSDIVLMGAATDPVMCFSPNSQLSSSSSPARQVTLSTIAPSGSFEIGPYKITGTANYSGGTIGSGLAMSAGVDADKCSVAGAINIPTTSGTGFISTTCSYPAGYMGSRPSYMNAVLQGVSSSSTGTIFLYP